VSGHTAQAEDRSRYPAAQLLKRLRIPTEHDVYYCASCAVYAALGFIAGLCSGVAIVTLLS